MCYMFCSIKSLYQAFFTTTTFNYLQLSFIPLKLITFLIKKLNMPLSKLFGSVLQLSKTKFLNIFKIYLRWPVKTLEIFSLYFCQLMDSKMVVKL